MQNPLPSTPRRGFEESSILGISRVENAINERTFAIMGKTMSNKNSRLKRKMRSDRKRKEKVQRTTETHDESLGFGESIESEWLREYKIMHRVFTYGYLSFGAAFLFGAITFKHWPSYFGTLLGAIYWGITLAFVVHTVAQTAYTKEKVKGFFLVIFGSIFGQYIYLRGMAGATLDKYKHHGNQQSMNQSLYPSSDADD